MVSINDYKKQQQFKDHRQSQLTEMYFYRGVPGWQSLEEGVWFRYYPDGNVGSIEERSVGAVGPYRWGFIPLLGVPRVGSSGTLMDAMIAVDMTAIQYEEDLALAEQVIRGEA